MKKPRHHVSDHAVVRYLERVRGMDIEAIRREIGRKADLAIEHGAGAVISDGFIYPVSGMTVTTVRPQNEPRLRGPRGPRRRDGDD